MSKKENFIESLQEAIESIQDAEFKELTEEQQDKINKNYNTYINFEYSADINTFIMSEDAFKRFEYYLGMEYEKDDIVNKIALDGNIFVAYDIDNDRVNDLIELLEESGEQA